ncbi:hypothetical protein AWC27_19250 [Mycobacterium szulgai]|uniref:PPE family domain-containing protein n=2 Tax=Mycobacterium szulgai TaxID=1787 RepID=A0A1X2FBJ9_MYCSZ|nr:hypothetical protein AWC27_19250 [Mycobacterium szulgai]
MAMDYGALPPEINSARMYSGPGSGSLLSAAAAWDGLAAELGATASGYASVIAELTSGPWIGPAAAAMVSAANPFVTWLGATATQAEETASRARMAAAAYETAFAMTVPPPAVAANRALLMALVATNFFGQNTAAIAATEAEYAEMWAQDAAAMYCYAGSSATATVLTAFTPAPATTDLTGPQRQAAAVAKATFESTMSSRAWQFVSSSAVSLALQQLSTHSVLSWWEEFVQWLEAHLPDLTPAERTTLVRLLGQSYLLLGATLYSVSIVQQAIPGTPGGAGDSGSSVLDNWGAKFPIGARGGAGQVQPYFDELDHLERMARPVSAVMGKAGSTGSLSTPRSWEATVRAFQGGPWEEQLDIVGKMAAAKTNAVLSGVPMTSAARHSSVADQRYGFRYRVMHRCPSAG